MSSDPDPSRMEPQPYPFYPRALPPIPECLQSPAILETAAFINEKLDRFNQIEDKQKEILASGQAWSEGYNYKPEEGHRKKKTGTSKKMELRLWKEMCPFVVLGTKHIYTTIVSMKKGIDNRKELENFERETNDLFELHKTLRFNRFTYEAFLSHIHDLWPGAPSIYDNKQPSEYTELRAAYCSTKWSKLRDSDRQHKPNKYLMYVYEAEKEYKMIQRYKNVLDSRGDDVAEQGWPNELINQRLKFLAEAKEELESRMEPEPEQAA
ncbi:uncharacterized protein Z520_08386 [Fonsecaea multimorphosa CBS 102226]|uniref:Uncharacterized protein n=1 Tax=Fonsecaea multimorphosa CBS 102226 TaxID=1442371 RepID=A0A0D2IGE7_9EURO|nr:uncharacterized protein Z520_08386 [Fonsecaea multimorphosa CBS 102226]KIX96131.1 hypothetical protein Z520_08386 [Fonsecaea multimorphosa CBS 102226]